MVLSESSLGVTSSGATVFVTVSNLAAFDLIKTGVVTETEKVKSKVVTSGEVTVIFQFWKQAGE